mgnify:CR=1 FL=1
MISKAKTMAVFMVLAMLAVCVVPLADNQGADAAVGDGQSYSYTIVYDSSKMATGTDSLSVDGMTAIYHPSYDPTSVTEEDDGTDGYGSWTWDLETGLGPFNSFYAAFDIDHGNVMVAKLNPFDLSKTIDGYDLDFTNHRYNIMWVLPTVYWKIGEISVEVPGEGDTTTTVTYPTLTLTNDATAGGTAYAHTINGHVYKYVAYGVYEAYNDTITVDGTSKTIVTSQTGKTPTSNVTRPNFRNYASNVEMDASLSLSEENPAYCLIWNFYQWELYKYCALTMMEDFNAQSTVGNGKVYTPNNNTRYNTTGLTDLMGPYAGTIGDITQSENDADSVKLFIENAWGSLNDLVDGVVFDYTEIYSSEVPDSQTTVDIYIQTVDKPTDTTDATLDYVDKIELSSRYQPDNDSKGGSETKTKEMVKVGEGAKIGEDAEDPSLTTNAYPLDIITNDARMWGFGVVAGGSATTGVSDYESLPNTTGGKLLQVGGTSNVSSVNWPRYGMSSADSAGGLLLMHLNLGARSAFVFDVDTTTVTTTVTFASNYDGYGTVDDENGDAVTSVDVPKGSIVSVDGDDLTIGYRTFTATPSDATAQYTYDVVEVGKWSIENGAQINANTTVTANFYRTLNSYTITWVYYEDGVQTSDTTTVDYGKTPSHAKVPARDNYTFAGWDPKPVPVTGATTYTATYTPIDYRVTWDPTGGTVTPKYSTGNIETAITEYPTPTRTHYTFVGWFTQPENGEEIAESITPTANVTYYAQWTADTYTVQFDAGEGSSASDETGSQMSPVTLPETTLADKTFMGWYTTATKGKLVGFDGTLYYPSADTTLYAVWSDTPIYTYSLNFNANGGYNAPVAALATDTDDEPYTFSIGFKEPLRAGQYFLGWATTSGATEAEYTYGDRIEVNPNESVTLYAVWSEEEPPGPYDWLSDVVAVVVAIGILMFAATALVFARPTGKDLVAVIVGIAVAIVMYVAVLLPILGFL